MLRSGCGCLYCTVDQWVSKCSEVGVGVYTVQLISRCPNAQKWVWMFMLYSLSAGVQMLRSGCGCLCCTVVQQVAKCSDR